MQRCHSANLILKVWVTWWLTLNFIHPELLKKKSRPNLASQPLLATKKKNGPDRPIHLTGIIFSFGTRKLALLKVEPYWTHPPQIFLSISSSYTLNGNWSVYLDLHPKNSLPSWRTGIVNKITRIFGISTCVCTCITYFLVIFMQSQLQGAYVRPTTPECFLYVALKQLFV